MPLVSIITPVKNAACWLPDCIGSVQQQSLRDWEWILVDDHSSDKSAAIIGKVAGKDERIKLFHAQGEGILPALQQALSAIQGQYVTRMDADDLMPADRLRLMTDKLSQSARRTVVTGKSEYFPREHLSEGYQKYQEWLNSNLTEDNPWKGIYRECVIASPNWIVRTEELRSIGGFDGLSYPEDYDLCFRWYEQGFQIETVPATTLLWREHPERTSRVSEHYNQQSFFDLKVKRFLELDYDPGKKLCLWGSGKKARITRSILRRKKIGFVSMSLESKREDTSESQVWYRLIEDMEEVQILLAVYPKKEEREKMEAYLESQGLVEGRDYWYL